MGDFVGNFNAFLDKQTYIKYNENGKSFENLLAEGIRQANFKAIQKQIFTSYATPTKEVVENE